MNSKNIKGEAVRWRTYGRASYFLLMLLAFTMLLQGYAIVTGGRLSDLPELFGRRRTIAWQKMADGHAFRVVQHWNGIDFYTTELQHIAPSGDVKTYVVDGDDERRTSATLIVNARKRTADIKLVDSTVHWYWSTIHW